MTPIASHRVLWIASAGMLGLSMGVIALAASLPIADGPAGGTSSSTADAVVASPGERISREQLERDASRPLRLPLIDAPAPMLSAPLQPLPPLPPLVGTIVEPGKSMALLQIPGASISFKRVGDLVADARIVTIDITGMTVTRRGQTVFIAISRSPARPSTKGAGT